MDPGSLRIKPLSSAKLLSKAKGEAGEVQAAGERQRVVCVLCNAVGPAKFLMGDGDVRVRCLTCNGEWSLTEPSHISDDEFEEATGERYDAEAMARREEHAAKARAGAPPTLATGTAPTTPPAADAVPRPIARSATGAIRALVADPGVDLDAVDEAAEEIDQCPKCRTRVHGRPACPACGLSRHRFAHFSAERNRRAAPELDGLWRAVSAAWDQPAVHKAFLERAVELGQFAPAAARYRAVLDKRKDDPVALAQLERLRRIVQVLMLNERPKEAAAEPSAFAGLTKIVIVIAVAAIALVAFYVLRKAKGGPAGEASAVEVEVEGAAPGDEAAAGERPRRRDEWRSNKRIRRGGAAATVHGEEAAPEGEDGEEAEGGGSADEENAAPAEAEAPSGEKIPFPPADPPTAPP